MFACNLLFLINRPSKPPKGTHGGGVRLAEFRNRPVLMGKMCKPWGGGCWVDGASGALILVFSWQVELDYRSSLCPCGFGRLSGIVRPGSDVDDTKD